MLYEFAMTPELFDKNVAEQSAAASIVLLQLLRGIAENGLIADLHKERWQKHVTNERLITLSQDVRDKIRTCLSLLHDRHRFVRHPKSRNGEPLNELDWLNTAIDEHEINPLHGILLSEQLLSACSRDCDSLMEFLSALDSPQWARRCARTLTLSKSEDDYRQALAPILRHAKTLDLVDPYFNTRESRYLKTIEIASALLGGRPQGRLSARIRIHADLSRQKPQDFPLEDYLFQWKTMLAPLQSDHGHRFQVFLWRAVEDGEIMHDRFILTDQCGISAPAGLDCRGAHSHANSTDWNLLDESVRARRLRDYVAGIGPFELAGSQLI